MEGDIVFEKHRSDGRIVHSLDPQFKPTLTGKVLMTRMQCNNPFEKALGCSVNITGLQEKLMVRFIQQINTAFEISLPG